MLPVALANSDELTPYVEELLVLPSAETAALFRASLICNCEWARNSSLVKFGDATFSIPLVAANKSSVIKLSCIKSTLMAVKVCNSSLLSNWLNWIEKLPSVTGSIESLESSPSPALIALWTSEAKVAAVYEPGLMSILLNPALPVVSSTLTVKKSLPQYVDLFKVGFASYVVLYCNGSVTTVIDGAVAVNAASSNTVEVTVADLETVLFDRSSK